MANTKPTTMVVKEDSKALALAPLKTSQTELTAFAEKVKTAATSIESTADLMRQVGEIEKVAWIKQSIILRVTCITAEGKRDKKKIADLMEKTGYSKSSINNYLRAGKLLLDDKKPVTTNDLKVYIGFTRTEKKAYLITAIEKCGEFSVVKGVTRHVYVAIKMTEEEVDENIEIAKRNKGKEDKDKEAAKGKQVLFHSLDDLTTASVIMASINDEGKISLAAKLADGSVEPEIDITFIQL